MTVFVFKHGMNTKDKQHEVLLINFNTVYFYYTILLSKCQVISSLYSEIFFLTKLRKYDTLILSNIV